MSSTCCPGARRSWKACWPATSVGFHIPRYAANFVQVARSLKDVEVLRRETVEDALVFEGTALNERTVPTCLSFEGREVAVTSPRLASMSHTSRSGRARPTPRPARREIRTEMGDTQLVLSVGRTDYTKGGVEQLLSFERLLERYRDLRGKVRLMHVSVSANRNMKAYEDVQGDIEQTAGRINGRFGTLGWQPIALISRAIPFAELVAYYRAADVAWITPLADGMNLVAKEFVASRVDGDGVLVLSEFAGAAVQLGSAVITNPFSNRSMDESIHAALVMAEETPRFRHFLSAKMDHSRA
jgi:trehalose-6-phosphate synthase